MDAAEARTRLPTVPEAVLKRRKAHDDREARVAAAQLRDRKKTAHRRRVVFKRAEAFISKYRKQERGKLHLTRLASMPEKSSVPEEQRLGFVIRIKGIEQAHPRIRKILQLLRLRMVNSGVFLKLNKATIAMLRLVEPFIAWGYPSMKSVHDLLHKRGFAKVEKRRVPITDNKMIEDALGSKDLICLEDLVHEIHSVGPHFKEAANFIWPFKLNTPSGGWTKAKSHFSEGGEFGNREDHINALLKRMI